MPLAQTATLQVLDSGMTMVQLPMSGRLATTIAIAFAAGARYEQPTEVGVAHLLEHMAFKGTESYRSATELNRAAEYLGTELDGASTADYVEFSAVVRAESTMSTLDLLTDVSGRALLAGDELEAERDVILQEIADADEDPASRADDRLVAALFAGHRLATSTTGGAAAVRTLTREQALAFRERQWSPERGLVVLAGNLEHVDPDGLADLLARIPARPAPPPPPPIAPFQRRLEIEERDGDVIHLRLAYSVDGVDLRGSRDRAAAEVYSDLLGGPMGSRLFEELRERRGLCYWVDGYVWGYEDSCYLSVECSVRPSRLAETYGCIEQVVNGLRRDGPTEEEARRARAYATGATALSFESSAARAEHAIGLVMEWDDHDVDPMLHLQALESVSVGDIAEVAARIRPGPCVGCVGPATAADFE